MTSKILPALVAVLVGAVALTFAACGDDDEPAAGGAAQTTAAKRGNSSEAAFLRGMAHHHESAIEMAEIGQKRAKADEIKQLANAIVTTQTSELSTMEKIHEDLFGEKLAPDPGAHDGLGLSAEEAGMTHTQADNEKLQTADPFDREFVDMMAPHHAGAVRMAEVVLTKTDNADLRKLAQNIIETQKAEIETMDSFRKREYGMGVSTTPAPHGGEKKDDAGHHSG